MSAWRLKYTTAPLAHRVQQLEGLRARRGGIKPLTHVGLGHDRETVTHTAQLAALTGGERVQVGVHRPRLLLRELPREQLQALGIERLDETGEAHLHARGAQRTDGVAEVALRLALVVGLGEALPGERLVGDLRLAAAGVRVVYRRPLRRPRVKRLARGAGRTVQPLAQPRVTLRVHHDRRHPIRRSPAW